LHQGEYSTNLAMANREFGIFALPTVLVPGELMPLHIFEPRYRELIGECLDTGEPFLLLYSDDEGTREVGCTAAVTELRERFDDGRLHIIVQGVDVVRVVEITRGRSFTTAMAVEAEEDLAVGDEGDAALELYRQIAAAGGGDPDEDLTALPTPLSYAIMARVDFPAEEKQRVLELRSERERMMAIIDLLARGLQALARIEQIRDRAAGNGRVPHGE
jgi:Lon protease-like protein